ncbi:MAG: CBS domain-containing protein [Synergistaceae bacterium]|nr:CBS domain-containing protein [Synergistaceae bacterium]
MKIGDLMNKDMIVLHEDDCIEKAIELILRHCRTGVPVLSQDGKVSGFVSEEDIIKNCLPGYITTLKNAAFLPDYGQFAKRFAAVRNRRVTDIMQKKVFCFKKEDSDFTVAAEMIRRHFKICPVVDDDGYYVGCVSRAYLIRAMMLEKNRGEKKEQRLRYE